MVDAELVERRLGEIEEATKYVSLLLEEGEEKFASSFKSRLALRHLILMIVESAASIALHILAEDFEERAESYGEAFEKLARRGVLKPETALEMAAMARLRNLIVHRYWLVDDLRIYREARGSGLEIVRRFVEEVRRYVRENQVL